MFKLYSRYYDRMRKEDRDIHTDISLEQIADNTNLKKLRSCELFYNAWKSGDKSMDYETLYKNAKKSLSAINCHNQGNFLKREFISTGYIVYDIDGLTKDEMKQVINYSKDFCAMIMISSSHGIKLFFEIEQNRFDTGNLLTEDTFKLYYKNFGTRYIQALNNQCKTTIELDETSNDTNRLCFVGEVVHIDENCGAINLKPYVTQLELDTLTYKNNQFATASTSGSPITIEVLSEIQICIDKLNANGTKLVFGYNELKDYGFMFASLIKMNNLDAQLVYDMYQQVVNLGLSPSNEWVTTSGTGNRYNIGEQLQTFVNDYDNRVKKVTIKSFFFNCNKVGVSKYKIVVQNY